ncbi:hypothetical protein TanjilG_30610 [Lupinus angustifolius]|uniref:B-like cyclin n=1 Tax=Lupinus angustifolius TaxID=3871 RepID=A0A4P1RNR4_LUPAN|nr:PREDICTED: cyclin-D3-1-like [Lupinus angustifolius]OIW14891.1 hypothetical protein TanjilG_30610 [Lupinus angustifolius]
MAHDLYCSEEQWEENIGLNELLEYNECVSDSTTSTIINSNKISNYPLTLLEQDMFWDDEELTSLLAKEQLNPLHTCIERDTVLEGARVEAVLWILRVNAHYSFSALTAILAVNYLDRFLFSFRFETRKPWMIHLSAVACISLAAKVEETQVPLLLDLQVEDSKYLFEAKTIKRMEILVLSTLGWKMNPPTPLSFLEYIIRRLGLKNDFNLCFEFLKRCESLLISLIPDTRFMSYLPSELATATIMHVINSVEPSLGAEYINQLLGILGTNKEKIDECCKVMLEVCSAYEQRKQWNKRKFGSIPSSPSGVMDVSFSSDSSNDSWALSTSAPASVSSSPEPLFKKTRTQDQILLNYSTSEFLTIPR